MEITEALAEGFQQPGIRKVFEPVGKVFGWNVVKGTGRKPVGYGRWQDCAPVAPLLYQLSVNQRLCRSVECKSVLAHQGGEGRELIHSVFVCPDRKRVHERQSLGRRKKVRVSGASLIEQTVEELRIGEVGEVFFVTHGVCERQPQASIATGEFGNFLRVHTAEIRKASRDQNFNDLGSFRVDPDDGGDFGFVLANIVFDRDQAEIRRSGCLAREKVVRVDGTVVQHHDCSMTVGGEPRQHLTRRGCGVRSEVGVDGLAPIESIASGRLLEQGLNEAGLPHAGKAHDTQCLVRGSHEVSDCLYSRLNIEFGSDPSW